MTETVELKVLTFNLWGIFNSRMKEQRMKHFATKIANYDVILLQEQFSEEDFELIMRSAPREVVETRYFRRFPSSFYGSGCAVISKYPIHSAFFFTYPLQGYPEMVLHGDFFANKGVALVKVLVPTVTESGAVKNCLVHLYTTHLVAIYQKVSELPSWRNERYLPFRISQAVSLGEFICNTSTPSDTIIVGGDFNSSQRSLEVQTLLILLKRRGYVMRSVLPTPNPDTAENPYTFSESNSFNSMKTSYFKLLKMGSDLPSQIDHIFFNSTQLSLQPFEECPDAESTFPFYVNEEDRMVPSGVVVFKSNQVPAPPSVPFRKKLADRLRQWASRRTDKFSTFLRNIADKCYPSHSTATSQSKENSVKYPLSDHYGVAAKLAFRNVEGSTETSALIGAPAVALTDDEAAVLSNVIQFLGEYTEKLRRQVTISRYIAITALFTFVVHIWVLRKLEDIQLYKATTVFANLYELGANNAPTSTSDDEKKDNSDLKVRLKHFALKTFRMNTREKKKVVIPNSSFSNLAKEVLGHSMLSTPYATGFINAVLAASGLASLGVGIFQRAGNANILNDQVEQLKKV